MGKALTMMAIIAAALAIPAAHATTVSSNTLPGVCNAEVVLYGSPAPGGQVVLYHGALGRGGISLQVYPNQGTKVCYTRAVDPAKCPGPMTQPVCAAVTDSPTDTLDIH